MIIVEFQLIYNDVKYKVRWKCDHHVSICFQVLEEIPL